MIKTATIIIVTVSAFRPVLAAGSRAARQLITMIICIMYSRGVAQTYSAGHPISGRQQGAPAGK